MARRLEKEKAIKLRKRGRSYSQIKEILGISKGTLSAWLRDYPLSVDRIKELRDHNHQRIENYRETRRRQREELLNDIYLRQKKEILPMSKRKLFLAGLFMYWAEGTKDKKFTTQCVANSDPAIIKFFIFWFENILKIKKENLNFRLHLYRDMNINGEINYWKNILGVRRVQFKKPYVKSSKLSNLSYKTGFRHGTCNIIFSNAIVGRKIFMSMKALRMSFLEKK